VANWSSEIGELGGSVTLVHNVSGGARGSRADFTLSRTGSKPDYNLLRLSGSYSRSLPQDWQLRAIVNGQYTPDALIPGEQFGAGGASSVRGFSEREISNDKGVGGNLELYTPNFCGSERWQCRALAFYDTAYIKRNHPLPSELVSTTIGSTGLGLRVLMATSLNLQLDYGHVVQAGATGRGSANRLHVRLGLSY
jgi:hemolysin activation/secretion protein